MFTKKNKRKKRMIVSLVMTLLLVAITVMPVFAAGSANPNCWGVVTSQRASTVHDVGIHASSQDSPRLGLGNAAQLFGFDHVSDLGSFLASIDELEATHCP